MKILSTQSSQILPGLFPTRALEDEPGSGQRVSVLHIGTPCSDSMHFFSNFRCRLQVIDLFAELPTPPEAETDNGLESYFSNLLQFPADQTFDICLFWDLFDHLDSVALPAFLSALTPHIHRDCRAHGFSVHNLRTPASNYLYGITDRNTLSLRARPSQLPDYKPHSQHQLNTLLRGFRMERTVLLPDRRLELSLRAK